MTVGRVGAFGGGLVGIVEGSPDALSYARSARAYQVGSTVVGVAAVGVLSYYLASAVSDDVSGVVYVAGVSLGLVAGGLQVVSQREQARAVWAYNRDVLGGQPE